MPSPVQAIGELNTCILLTLGSSHINSADKSDTIKKKKIHLTSSDSDDAQHVELICAMHGLVREMTVPARWRNHSPSVISLYEWRNGGP